LVAVLAIVGWRAFPGVRRGRRRRPAPALAGIGVSARPVRARTFLAVFLGEQSSGGRGLGPVHGRAHLAALAAGEAMEGFRARGAGARGAAAKRARRREPRAGRVLPAMGTGPAAPAAARGPGRRRALSAGLWRAHGAHAGIP